MQKNLLNDFSCISPIITPPVTQESNEQFIERWNKFDALPEIIKDKLSDSKTSDIIKTTGKNFSLDLFQISCISRAIRSYYFGELALEDFSFVLAKEMHIDIDKARKIFQIIKEKIIDDDSYEKTLQVNLANLPFSEALRLHPEIGEQLVTSEKISLRNFPYPVRPSVKNWLADYTFNLGYKKHETMARSQYLFQGANAKNLPAAEKQKLAYLLKSFDENSPITINKKTKQIVFPARIATPARNDVATSGKQSVADGPANNASSTSNTSHSNVDWRSIAKGSAIIPTNTPLVNSNLPKGLIDQYRPVPAPKAEQKNINALQFSYRQTLPYEKTLPNSVPTQAPTRNFPTSSRNIPAEKPSAPLLSRKPSFQNPPINLSPAPNPPQNIVNLKSANSILSP